MPLTVSHPATQLAGATQPIFAGPVSTAPIASGLTGCGDTKLSLVRFEAGSATVPHTHESDQLLLVTSGRGRVRTVTEVVEVSAGDSVLIPSGTLHVHEAHPDEHLAHVSVLGTGSSALQRDAEVAG